jgi:hypothetical protein
MGRSRREGACSRSRPRKRQRWGSHWVSAVRSIRNRSRHSGSAAPVGRAWHSERRRRFSQERRRSLRKPWGSTDRNNWWPWLAHIRSAKFCIKIFWRCNCPRAGLTAFSQTRALSRTQPGIAQGSAGIVYNVEAAGRAVLLKPGGKQRGGLERRSRYACFCDLNTWRDYVTSAGFVEVGHYYRPPAPPSPRDSRSMSSR